MNKEQIQTVLDALQTVDSCVGLKNYFHDKPDGTDVRLDQVVDEAIAILQAALAEPSEQPVAWLNTLKKNGYQEVDTKPATNTDMWENTPLFTHPASKPAPLPELTDEDIIKVAKNILGDYYHDQNWPFFTEEVKMFARAILAARGKK